jgi:sugar phosphate isomerase/epimerase
MKFALLTVSYSGLFYAGKGLSLEQQIHKAKELGFDALSIETKRPVASPLDLDPAARLHIRDLAREEGISLCALESLSDFSSRVMESRENNLAMMQLVLRLAHDLGIGLVKVFAAWPGLVDDEEAFAQYSPYDRVPYYKRLSADDLRKWNRAVRGIREVAGWAADLGITLALQNHAPVIRAGYEDVLAMQQEIARDNVKLCLDVPLFQERQDDEYIELAVRKTAGLVALTHFGAWNFSQRSNGEIVQDPSPSFGAPINYLAFFQALEQTGYPGCLVSEYCLPVIRQHQLAGMDEVDKANRISLKYMKGLVKEFSPAL